MGSQSSRRIISTLAALTGSAIGTYVFAIRPWHVKWGATDEEIQMSLPGDQLVPEPKFSATHAITIEAPAAAIWPWLIQMGQGRGGMYSYDWIENLMGLDFHSADRIIPEFQHLEVGEQVPLAPGGFGIPVAAMEQDKFLVLHGDSRTGDSPVPITRPGDYINASWTFFLDEQQDGTTRLVERFRVDYNPSLQNTLFYRAMLEPGSFIMERKMLLGIKQRAEAEASH